ncbi:MAG: hypothetical protein K8R77_10895 [Anaerolineaceae bacterium]|nr:hypothetical protein [Anaerolineaceae bacterium]
MSKRFFSASKLEINDAILPILLLVAARLMLLMSQPLNALWGYGDSIHFYDLAALPGWPYFDHWVEFPPVFPFLSETIFRVANGKQHIFTTLLVVVFSIADVGNLWMFMRIQKKIEPAPQTWRLWTYFAYLVVLAYGWWYFDPLAVFCMLLGVDSLLNRRDTAAGVSLGMGLLVKLFPVLGLVILWRQPIKKIVKIGLITFAVGLMIYVCLWLLSPEFTMASLLSQTSKGSWETVWALIDGNYRTGNFGPVDLRLDAGMVTASQGQQARISPWLTLLVFAGVGIAGLLQTQNETPRQRIAVLGWGFALLFLWSSGWSPQWLLYLLPLILLVFPKTMALMGSLVFVLVNLLEWPVILSRGWFHLLPLTIILRTLILVLAAFQFYEITSGRQSMDQP